VVLDAINVSPLDLPYSLRHGRNHVTGVAAAASELRVQVPYDPDATRLIVECETWCPSDVLGTSDEREIGLGVRSITLCDS
jgi:hypothetical protein